MTLWKNAEKGFAKSFRGYRLDFSLRNVLRASRLLEEKGIGEKIKVRETLRLLLGRTSFLRTLLLSDERRNELALGLFGLLGGGKIGKRILDFERDSALIYGAFLGTFGIDLLSERLDFRTFSALLSALPESTRLYEIMRIRAAEIPPENAFNSEYIKSLRELKAVFSLEEESFEAGLSRLFSALSDKREQI